MLTFIRKCGLTVDQLNHSLNTTFKGLESEFSWLMHELAHQRMPAIHNATIFWTFWPHWWRAYVPPLSPPSAAPCWIVRPAMTHLFTCMPPHALSIVSIYPFSPLTSDKELFEVASIFWKCIFDWGTVTPDSIRDFVYELHFYTAGRNIDRRFCPCVPSPG